MAVDAASRAVGIDWCEGYSAVQVRDVPTGGGCRAVTTARNDPGGDWTTGDSPGGMSIRLRSPVGQKFEAVLGESGEECMALGRKLCPKQFYGGGAGHHNEL